VDQFNIAYAFYAGTNELAAQEIMIKQLSYYIKDNLNYCLRDFEAFEEKGYEFKISDFEPDISVAKDSLEIKLHFPFEVEYEGSSATGDIYRVSLPLDFTSVYSVVDDLVDTIEAAGPNALDVGVLADSGYDLDVLHTGSTIVYTLVDKALTLKNKRYVFLFAVDRS
jgi:hypothetical protein